MPPTATCHQLSVVDIAIISRHNCWHQQVIFALMAINYEVYNKAVNALANALALPEDDISRDASIQRFEFCIELAWKTARRHLGTATTGPKQVVREMAQAELIENVGLWLEAIDQRNLSSHTYNEEIARKVYNFAGDFLSELQLLSNRLN